MSQFSEKIKSNLFNIPGWHTGKKIIVFESDDWGSIRIPSRDVFDQLIRKGYPLDRTTYGFDCLENEEDLTCLLELLSKHSTRPGSNPVLTMNNIVANPDFAKIRKNNFQYYFYEDFTATYLRLPGSGRNIDLLREGYRMKLFSFQFHGRDHINSGRWLEALRNEKKETMELFELGMYALPQSLSRDHEKTLQRAFDFTSPEERKNGCDSIREGLSIFRNIWGYNATSFIAPNYFWDATIEKCLINESVRYLQGQRAQLIPNNSARARVRYHYTGQRNKYNQIYLVRNCFFEPASDKAIDWVGSCLKEISRAFTWKKPAIVGTHRVNYVGSIDPLKRQLSLRNLDSLLTNIREIWPEVEFMTTEQLGKSIESS